MWVAPFTDDSVAGPDPDPDGSGDPGGRAGSGRRGSRWCRSPPMPRSAWPRRRAWTGPRSPSTSSSSTAATPKRPTSRCPTTSTTCSAPAPHTVTSIVKTSGPATFGENASYTGSGAEVDLVAAGSSLQPGQTAGIRVVVDVDSVTDQGSGLGVYGNAVTSSSNGPGGVGGPFTDASVSGTDPDPDGSGDPGDAGGDRRRSDPHRRPRRRHDRRREGGRG